MAASPVRKVLCSATLVASAWIGALPSAQAAIVPGRFDPPFGSALSGVGYKGTAYFTIADSCLTTATYNGGGGFIYSDYDCDGGAPSNAGMSLTSAHVDFYDTSNPSTILGTVDFGPSSTAVLGMYVTTSGGINTVVGVQTSLIAGNAPSTLSGNPSFYIQFGVLDPITGGSAAPGGPEDHLPGAPEATEIPPDIDELPASDFQRVTMFKVPQSGDCTTNATGQTSGLCQSNAAALVIPEPGSIALSLGALAAAGWAGRRRQD